MKKTVKIYYTSDIHGHIFPTDYISRETKPIGLLACAGEYEKDGDTLVIDGGDMLQGSPFAYYAQKSADPAPLAEAVNGGGYDIVTIGNHDFNYGTGYLDAYVSRLQAACVCENIRDRRTGAYPFGWVKRRLAGGLCIGIAGIVTDFVNVWEKRENLGAYEVEPPFAAAKRALEQMKGEVDITVCVYHGGFEAEPETGRMLENTGENIGCQICRELEYDLLLTGHQHMEVPGREVCGTYVIQPPCYGMAYCSLLLVYDGKLKITSRICAPEGRRVLQCPGLDRTEEKVQAWLDGPLGCLKQDMFPKDRLYMALHGSPIADFINRIQIEATGADISCTSLANDIRGFHRHVTARDILTTYPFPNTLVVLEVSGEVLKAALERSAEYFEAEEGRIRISPEFLYPKEEHYNYDFFYGIQFDRDLSAPKGERISRLMYQGKALRRDDSLTLCLNSYRATGAGGYGMYLKCRKVQEGTREVAEEIIRYFQDNPSPNEK